MRKFKLLFPVLAISLVFVSCSDDEPEAPTVFRRVIDFENTNVVLAGPTSYGSDLYANYSGTKFVRGSVEIEKGVNLEFGLNYSQYSNDYDFSAGGMVLSQWNYRSDAPGEAEGWWYTYNNQCSVYNTASADGENKGAGAGGSNTFALINGYDDPNAFQGAPSFNMSNGAEYIVENIQICPTSYLYGVITKGNAFGNNPGMTLEEADGWFKILAYGYDASGNATNGGRPVEKYICDYRYTTNPKIEIASTWQTWDLSPLGKVNKVKFSFEGSDSGVYGLNTPAYMCVDNITLRMN